MSLPRINAVKRTLLIEISKELEIECRVCRNLSMSTTSGTVLNSSIRRGRRATTPTTELGCWLQQQLDLIPLSRAEFARRLHVSPSTISRLLNGDTRVVQKVSVEGICEVLRLEEMDRRIFLQLVATATTETFAFATGAQVPTIKKQKIDLDLADDHAEALHLLPHFSMDGVIWRD